MIRQLSLMRGAWLVVGVFLCCGAEAALGQAAPPQEADLVFRPVHLINGHQHDVGRDGRPWTQDRFDPDCSFSVLGQTLVVDLRRASPASDGAALRVAVKLPAGEGGLAHTIDVTAARPGNHWERMPATGLGVGWSVGVPVNANSCKRYGVLLGDAGEGSHPQVYDQITVAIQGPDKYAPPTLHKVRVPGLNVAQMNRYRAAMSSGGELRVYVNDRAEPVFHAPQLPTLAGDDHHATFGLIAPRSATDRWGMARFRLDISSVAIETDDVLFAPPGAAPAPALATAAHPEDGSLVLAVEGKPTFRIVVEPDSDDLERAAAAELVDHLERVIGSRVETASEATEGTNLFVGRSPRVEAMLPDVRWAELGPDGIVVRTVGDDLVLSGAESRGTVYAVCTFLEEVIGCRWWAPDAEMIPSKPDLQVPPQRVVYRPPFDLRHLRTTPLADKRFAWRMRQNGNFVGWDTGDHSIHKLLPAKDHFVEHPEWFMYRPDDGDPKNKYAYVNGLQYVKEGRPPEWYPVAEKNRRLPWQPCLTHPGAREVIVANALKELAEIYPSFPTTPKVLWVSQSDGGWQCRCENCEKLLAREGSESAAWVEVCNLVAERAAERYPDVMIATLAYLHTEAPPKSVKPHPNVVIYPAFLDRNHLQPISELGGPSAHLRTWCKIANSVYVWDYDTNFRNWLTPYPQYFTTARSLRFYRQLGVKGAMIQGSAGIDSEFQRMRAYVVAHLMWNPDLDARALTVEFLDGYYGAAGPHLMKCIDTFSRAVNRRKDFFLSCYAGSTEGWLTIADMNAATRAFDEAEKAVAGDPPLLARVRRGRSAVDLVWVLRHDQLLVEAKQKKVVFLGPKDPVAARQPFLDNVFAFETYGENRPYGDFAAELRKLTFEERDDSDFEIRGTN